MLEYNVHIMLYTCLCWLVDWFVCFDKHVPKLVVVEADLATTQKLKLSISCCDGDIVPTTGQFTERGQLEGRGGR